MIVDNADAGIKPRRGVMILEDTNAGTKPGLILQKNGSATFFHVGGSIQKRKRHRFYHDESVARGSKGYDNAIRFLFVTFYCMIIKP